MFVFQVPWLPEKLLSGDNYQWLKDSLTESSNPNTFSEEDFDEYIRVWSQPGALTGMINWYRSALRNPPTPKLSKVPVPMTILWGRKDQFLGEELAELSRPYAEQLDKIHYVDNAGHWLVHEQSDTVNQILLDFIQSLK